MGLLELFDKLITEHGSSAIQKERIVQLREQMERLQREYDQLKVAHESLLNENQILRQKLEQRVVPDDYIEHRGALFRRLANGKIQDEAYCRACKVPMTSLGGMLPFQCSKCRLQVNFIGSDLPTVVAEIQN